MTVVAVARAIAESPVYIFYAPVAVKGHEAIFEKYRFARLYHSVDEWSDRIPYFRPDIPARFPNSGMLAIHTEAGQKSIVIEADELRPPEKEHGKSRMQKNAQGCPEAGAPVFGWAQDRLLPVKFPDQTASLARILQEGVVVTCLGFGNGHATANRHKIREIMAVPFGGRSIQSAQVHPYDIAFFSALRNT